LTADIDALGWRLDHAYARLPSALYEASAPARFPAPALVVANHALARGIGLDLGRTDDRELAALCTGQRLPSGAQPIAQVVHRHGAARRRRRWR
jgi:uncharacterized protein YdiU (UPF0061 family)